MTGKLETKTRIIICHGKVYQKRCRTCGTIISGPSPEELQREIGIHIGQTKHRRFTEL